jgi:hypothetical protein
VQGIDTGRASLCLRNLARRAACRGRGNDVEGWLEAVAFGSRAAGRASSVFVSNTKSNATFHTVGACKRSTARYSTAVAGKRLRTSSIAVAKCQTRSYENPSQAAICSASGPNPHAITRAFCPWRASDVRPPEIDQVRVGLAFIPRDDGLALLGLAVENLEPAGRVAFVDIFGGGFADAHSRDRARSKKPPISHRGLFAAKVVVVVSRRRPAQAFAERRWKSARASRSRPARPRGSGPCCRSERQLPGAS